MAGESSSIVVSVHGQDNGGGCIKLKKQKQKIIDSL